MTALKRYKQTELAIWLLEFGFKPMIVANETGVSAQRARELHWDIHGSGSKSGQIKSPDGAVRTASAYASASFCMSIYANITPDYKSFTNMRTLVRAIDIHSGLGLPRECQLTCNEFYNIAVALRSGCAIMLECRQCEAKYLSVNNMHFAPYCPYCAMDSKR